MMRFKNVRDYFSVKNPNTSVIYSAVGCVVKRAVSYNGLFVRSGRNDARKFGRKIVT